MNKKIFRKVLSICLCLAITIGLINPATAFAEEKEYLKVQKKIKEQYSQGIPPEDIFEQLSETEIEALVNSFSDESQVVPFSVVDVENNPEVKFIDALAQEYYDYYEEHGCFPEENENEGISSRNYISSDSYSSIIKSIGYTYTNAQIAQQLVIMGNLILLSAPMFFSHLLAVILGLAIVALTVAILYCAQGIITDNQVGVWYSNSTSNISTSRSYSAAVAAQYQNGARYWNAYTVDIAGFGGILVSEPISLNTAQSFVTANPLYPINNVFCVNLTEALALTGSVNSGGHYGPEAHRDNGKIMNHQHIHSKLVQPQHGTNHGKVHIFFAIPYVS